MRKLIFSLLFNECWPFNNGYDEFLILEFVILMLLYCFKIMAFVLKY